MLGASCLQLYIRQHSPTEEGGGARNLNYLSIFAFIRLDKIPPSTKTRPILREPIAMASKGPLKIERATIAGSIEIPRILNGLWQLAGGHDEHVDIAAAADAMKPL